MLKKMQAPFSYSSINSLCGVKKRKKKGERKERKRKGKKEREKESSQI